MAHVVDTKVPLDEDEEMDSSSCPDDLDLSSISRATSLVSPGEREYDLLTSRLRGLIEAGRGECIFDVGVPLVDADASSDQVAGLCPEEMSASVATLRAMADTLGAQVVGLRERTVEEGKRSTAQFLVRRRCEEKDFMEIRIAVVGNVDAGKKPPD